MDKTPSILDRGIQGFFNRMAKEAENAEENYLWYRNRMIEFGIPVPPEVLRKHLDTKRQAQQVRPGLHMVVITVTRNPVKGLVNFRDIIEGDFIIRAEGERYIEP